MENKKIHSRIARIRPTLITLPDELDGRTSIGKCNKSK
jgi:hypothetical protein